MFILLLLLASTVFTLCMLVEGATYLYTMLFQRLNLSAYKRSNANVWAIVTGANHGIGLAFARKLAECGFNVLLHGRNQEKLTAIKEELHRKFPNLHFQTVVADATDISEANIMRVVHACHDKDVAILVNNVGIAQHGKFQSLQHLDYQDIQCTVNVNCLFLVLLTRALLPRLLERSSNCSPSQSSNPSMQCTRSAIINLSSFYAFAACPGFSVYAASKAFVHSFSETLAAEAVCHNIDVLNVSPGYVSSGMTQEPRTNWLISSPESVAENSLRRINCVDIVPGFLPMPTFLAFAAINFIPSLLRPRLAALIMRVFPKPRAFKVAL